MKEIVEIEGGQSYRMWSYHANYLSTFDDDSTIVYSKSEEDIAWLLASVISLIQDW